MNKHLYNKEHYAKLSTKELFELLDYHGKIRERASQKKQRESAHAQYNKIKDVLNERHGEQTVGEHYRQNYY